jgi:hypothetical protein
MKQHISLTGKHQGALLALLGLGVFAPVLLAATSPPWFPDWLGAAIALAALFGALIVFWRAGGMRAGYLILFAAAVALAAALGQLR